MILLFIVYLTIDIIRIDQNYACIVSLKCMESNEFMGFMDKLMYINLNMGSS